MPKNPTAYPQLAKADKILIDKHIWAMERGEYGEKTWPKGMHDIHHIREFVLAQNPQILAQLKDTLSHPGKSFLEQEKNYAPSTVENFFRGRYPAPRANSVNPQDRKGGNTRGR